MENIWHDSVSSFILKILKIFKGALARLDESLGRVVSSLGDRGMLRNSVILFMTDNGGATIGKNRNFASNWPLRGVSQKLEKKKKNFQFQFYNIFLYFFRRSIRCSRVECAV